ARQELDLETGDLVFLYTDGLTSACGPDLVQFEERLTDELAALAGKPPTVLLSRVRDVVLELCGGELRDDMTMLAVQIPEPPGCPAPVGRAVRQSRNARCPGGALNLYARGVAAFGPAQVRRAENLAENASGALSMMLRLASYSELTEQLRSSLTSRAVIYQA